MDRYWVGGVGVMNQPPVGIGCVRSPGPECLFEGVEGQVGTQQAGFSPADDEPRVRVDHQRLGRRSPTRSEHRCRGRTCNFGCIRLSMCSCHLWFSLVCITRTRRSASPRSGHGAPVFTSGLRDQHLGLRTHWTPSPCDRLSRSRTTNFGSSAPSHRHQPATDLPAGQRAAGR